MTYELDLFEIKDPESPYLEELKNSFLSYNLPLKDLDKRFLDIMSDDRK